LEVRRSDTTSYSKYSSFKVLKNMCYKRLGWEQQFDKCLTLKIEIVLNLLQFSVFVESNFEKLVTVISVRTTYILTFSIPLIVTKFLIYKTNIYTPNINIRRLCVGSNVLLVLLYLCVQLYNRTSNMLTTYTKRKDTWYGDNIHNVSRIRLDILIQRRNRQRYIKQNFNHILRELTFLNSGAEITTI
jgi:hypothetical protein